MYELGDLEGHPVTKRAAKELIASQYTITPKQRSQSRSDSIEATGTPDTVTIAITDTVWPVPSRMDGTSRHWPCWDECG